MMSWHKITITVDEVIRGRHVAIQQAFRRIWIAALRPIDAALFSEPLGPDGGCTLYFSPGAMRFAKFLVRSKCGVLSNPPPKHAHLIVGHTKQRTELLEPTEP